MKRLLFSISTFLVLASASIYGFDNQTTVKTVAEDTPCNWKIVVVDSEGNVLEYTTHNGLEGAEDCLKRYMADVSYYEDHYPVNKGYKITATHW